MDRVLFQDNLHAIKRYDPNSAKPRFRELINNELEHHGTLWQLVSQLPSDVKEKYERTCKENEFFTIADLWSVINDYRSEEKSAEELLLMEAYINQQALADAISSGISGSDWGHPWRPSLIRPRADVTLNNLPRTPDELLEHAEFPLDAPALELLAELSPDEINELRTRADATVFGIAVPEGTSQAELRRVTNSAIEEYGSYICDYLYKKHPNGAREKRSLFIFLENKIPDYQRLRREFPKVRDIVDIVIDVLVATHNPVPGTGGRVKGALRKLGYRILYCPTDRFLQLREMKPRLWAPQAAWVSSAPLKLDD